MLCPSPLSDKGILFNKICYFKGTKQNISRVCKGRNKQVLARMQCIEFTRVTKTFPLWDTRWQAPGNRHWKPFLIYSVLDAWIPPPDTQGEKNRSRCYAFRVIAGVQNHYTQPPLLASLQQQIHLGGHTAAPHPSTALNHRVPAPHIVLGQPSSHLKGDHTKRKSHICDQASNSCCFYKDCCWQIAHFPFPFKRE